MSKFINLIRVRQRLAEMTEQICQEEGLEVRVTINIIQAPNPEKKNVTIEVVEQTNKQPKEVVN